MTADRSLRRDIVDLIPRLRRFALGLTGSPADADDLVQTALEKALSRLDQYVPGTRLDSWLCRIVQTSWIDNRRKASRREDTMDTEAMDRITDTGITNHADRHGIRADVDRALATLSDDQRALVILVLVEGYSYQEAADLSGVPVGTVMSRLSRARMQMTRFLTQPGELA